LVDHVETGEKCVDKYYDMRELDRRLFASGRTAVDAVERELSIISKCNHGHLIRPLCCFEDQMTGTFHFILPDVSQSSLQQICEGKPGPIVQCFYQIAQALKYLHSKDVVHRDIKPSNILCQDLNLYVLSDFSVASQLEADGLLADTQGSPAFLSPEELKGGKFDARKADVWSYGMTMFWSVFGGFPFGIDECNGQEICMTLIAIRRCLETNPLILPENADVGPLWRELIMKCLTKNAKDRPTFEQIVADPLFYSLS
jgi:serine/threonine protein kinase